jgi:hypothetical protein
MNPWNGIYKIASRNTTEGKYDNSTKTGWNNNCRYIQTLTVTLEHLILQDNIQDDTDYHRANRSLAEQPIHTPDDKDFTQDEVRQVVERFKPRKAPGPDGITNKIQQLIYKGIHITMTAIYNEYLKQGAFPLTGKRQEYFQ